MIGVIHIEGEHREIYKDNVGFFYVKEEYVDIHGPNGISLKAHIHEMQDIMNIHPDARLDWSRGYGDQTIVVRYDVYVDSNDDRIVKLLDKVKANEEKAKLKQKERDEKTLKEIKKRSPGLFK